MGKIRGYITDYGIWYTHFIWNRELVDLDRERFAGNRNFKAWEEVFPGLYDKIYKGIIKFKHFYDGRRKRVYSIIVGHIIATFCKMLVKDLIMDNIIYYFPNKAAHIKIGHNGSLKSYYNIKTRGKLYTPLVIRNKAALLRSGRSYYYMRLTEPWRRLLHKEINNGHEY